MIRRRFGRGLQLQYALAFAVGVAVILGASGGFFAYRIGRVVAAHEAELARSMAAALDVEWNRQSADLESRIAQLQPWIRRDVVQVERLLSGDRLAIELAQNAAMVTGLDTLLLVDSQGRVLSAWPRPERFGLPFSDPWPDRLKVSIEVGGWVTGMADQEGEAWVVAPFNLQLAGESVRIFAGKRWDPTLFETHLAPVIQLEWSGTLGGVGESTTSPDRQRRWVSTLRGDPQRVAGDGWVEAQAELPGGATVTWRVGGLQGPVDVRLRILQNVGWLGLFLIPAAAWIGWLSARASSAPVDRLIEAVDAIAAGDADYTFPQAAGDEFDELAESFSRLHRSLEEQQLKTRVTERVAAWRDVARQVAHDVKNPLAPIRLTVQNLLRARDQAPDRFPEMFREGSKTILEEVDRLARLVEEFSEFARLPEPQRKPLDLVDLVRDTQALYDGDPGVEIVMDSPESAGIFGDRDQLARALGNLVKNAVEASNGSAESGESGPRRVELRLEANEGFDLHIDDRGPGFAAETTDRFFEPYVTTKPGGTGLGLAITMRIVQEHGGWIRAENREGGGARVTVHLPLPTEGAA